MLYKNTLPLSERNRHGNQSNLVDRIWIEKEYLPNLYGEVLYVGVKCYTDFYHEFIRTPSLFTTVDLDPNVAKFGSPYEHHVSDILTFLNNCGKLYDHISVFGLFGCDGSVIKDKETIIVILNQCYDHVKSTGTIQTGMSTDVFSVEDARTIIGESKLKETKTISSFVCRPSPIHSEVFMFWGQK